jgi:hypothetical protein
MNIATKERYVLYHLALVDMERTRRSLEYRDKTKDSHLRDALLRDAVVCYAKPFSSNKGLSGQSGLRVASAFVPTDLSGAHNEILDLRNQLFAHMDIDKQAPNVSVDIVDGEKHVSFSVKGYERVFAEHLVEPLRILAHKAHLSFMDELDLITKSDA